MKKQLTSVLALLALAGVSAGTGAPLWSAAPQQARGAAAQAQAASQSAAQSAALADSQARRAEIYYDLTLGHLFAQDYLNSNDASDATQAIDYYKKAYALDPTSQVIGEELAEVYFVSQRSREAVTEAQAVLQRDPSNLSARRLLVRIYIRSLGDVKNQSDQEDAVRKAITQLTEIVKRDPADRESALWLARLDRLDNRADQAEQVLRSILAADPENDGAIEQLTQLLIDEGKNSDAIALLQKSLAREPNPALYDRLGDAYAQVHNLPRAEDAYRHAVDLEPDRPSHLHGLGQTLLDERKYREAAEILERLVAAEPNEVANYLRLSETYTQLHDWDKAEQQLAAAKTHSSNNLEVTYDEASLYEAEGRYDDAIKVLGGAVDATKSQSTVAPTRRRTLAILYQLLGQLYREDQNFASAVSTFQELGMLGPEEDQRARALIVDAYRANRDLPHAFEAARQGVADYPKDRTLKVTEASLYGDNNQPDQAAAILRPMLNNSPADLEIQLDLAQIFVESRRFDQAEEAIRSAEKLGNQPTDRETIDFLRGDLFARQGKYDQAEQMFKGALAINPRNASVLNYFGYTLADRGIRLDEAVAMLKQALEQEPNNAAFLDSIGWAYFKQDKLPEAETYLRQAVSHETHDPNMRTHLGDVLMKRGHPELAVVEWQKALDEWHRALPAEYEADKVAALEQKLSTVKNRTAQNAPRDDASQ